jgi:ParB family transcriptional regulator, chromosome partitioning protein
MTRDLAAQKLIFNSPRKLSRMSKEPERNPRKVLGKGLSALHPPRPVAVPRTESPTPDPEAAILPKTSMPEPFQHFQSIPLDDILPGTEQPRQFFDHDRLDELAHSIKTNGLLQPITVQREPDGRYRMIAGERRWRAAKVVGLTEIPAFVRSVEESQRLELALIENIQREDLNALEIANAFQRLVSEHHLSHEQIADRTGKDRSTVTNFLRLLRLGEEARNALKNGVISMGHARALLNLTDENKQAETCRDIIRRGLSVRDTESIVKRLTAPVPSDRSASSPEPSKIDPNIRAALDEMAMALGTKVHLTARKLEIEYYSQEDLERIYSVIVKQ